MADFESYPSSVPENPEAKRRRILGCVGGGAVGLVVTAVSVLVLIGVLSNLATSCEFRLANDPGPGTASQHLPVQISPRSGLRDGSVVTVDSTAFQARSVVGVAVCLREADTKQRGVAACDEVQGARYAVDPTGRLHATYAVPRRIRVGGQVRDCGVRAERCVLVAADASDYDRSGGQPITFDPREAPPTRKVPRTRPQTDHLQAGGQPAGPVPWGTEITMLATGFQPGEPLLAAYCTDAFDQEGPWACDPLDFDAAFDALMGRDNLSFALRATESGAATVTLRARRKIDVVPSSGSGDETDCRTEPGRCALVIAAAADIKRSAVLPYTLEPG
jgi:hypothetical protein